MNWKEIINGLTDDKSLVILTVLLLGLGILLTGELSAEKVSIFNSIFSGLFGIAVGRAIGADKQ